MDILLQSVALLYLTLITIVFLKQKKPKKIENFVYKGMLALIYVEIFFDIAYHIACYYAPGTFLATALAKLFICSSFTWALAFSSYVYVLSSPRNTGEAMDDEMKRFFIKKFLYVVVVIVISDIIACFLPLTIDIKPEYIRLDGLCQYFMYAVIGSTTIVNLFTVIKNKKSIKDKKFTIVWLFSFLLIIGLILQMLFPFVSVNVTIATIMTMIMYFEIENPDLDMIKDLNIATNAAESANHAKSDFLSSMSHEIRTPLNAIIGFSQALAKEDISGSAKEEVKDILIASNNLLEIVNGILDISKIEAQKIEIVNVDYSTKHLFNELSALTNSRIGSKPLEFKTEIDQNLPPALIGDVVRIKQILLNLLTNAVKYTKEGYVLLQVKSETNENKVKLTMSVEDSGIGMTEEDLSNLYTKFQRFDLDKNINIAGTGLGMAITKGLVELMNGEITVKSTYGEGTTFTVVLEQELSTKPVEEIEANKQFTSIAPFDGKGQRVLVVDDNKINLKVAEKLLEDYNLTIDLAESGQECIDKVMNSKEYDLIFLDIMMPKMKGPEVVANLRKISGFKTPVVALTADVISGMEDKYTAQGFNDCMSKPIEDEDLYYILKKFLKDDTDPQVMYNDGTYDEEPEEKTTPVVEETTVVEEQPVVVESKIEEVPVVTEKSKEEQTPTNETQNQNDRIKNLEFLSKIEPTMTKLQEYANAGDTANYATTISSMIDDAKNLGYIDFVKTALEYQVESKNNNADFIKNNFPKLKMESIRLTDTIKKQLER